MAARKKPDYMRVVEGGVRKARPPDAPPADDVAPPMPLSEFVDPPHWLNDVQKDIWKYAVKGVPDGQLRKTDASVFTVWVVACALHAEAVQQVNRLGQLVKSPVQGVPMQNPYLASLNKQALIMIKAAQDLGFSPRSRSRVKADGKKKGASSPFGDLKSLLDD